MTNGELTAEKKKKKHMADYEKVKVKITVPIVWPGECIGSGSDETTNTYLNQMISS